MRRPTALVIGIVVLVVVVLGAAAAVLVRGGSGGANVPASGTNVADGSPRSGKNGLTWADDFDGPAGDPPDKNRWVHEVGGHGWGNQELEYYTDSTRNAKLDGNGNLVITAREDTSGGNCWYGPCRYTSARLITKQKFDQAYGRFEARIKLPRGQGIWPAFWMLGNDIGTVGWPACGEIDVMEYLGHQETVIHGSLHGPGLDTTADYTAPHSFADGFHVFAVDWSPAKVKFFVDGHHYATERKPADATGWAFDHPFFLLLNVAVGGNWPGSPDESTTFPQRMLVDYVRAYPPPAQ